ncbi:MAG: aspartate kinase [Gammaproteobacteria bacterium]|nr:aspartate kinase [Gammaproteobacteria bacterium]MDH5629235.1 aspartate kinase [Gammaproteobacteria bacterium]
MKVLKFGGTSLGNPERMHNVANIVSGQGKVMVVLSAVAGTTDKLTEIVGLMKNGDYQAVQEEVDKLQSHYQQYVSRLFDNEYEISQGHKTTDSYLEEIKSLASASYVSEFEYQVLAKGEQISTALFQQLLNWQGKSSQLLNALDYLQLSQNGEPDEEQLKQSLQTKIQASADTQIFVIQGFICQDAVGNVSNLKRGGSDYSASLFGAALNCDEIQIWTDIDGMHNNDPRYVEKTKPIRELSFAEAAELAYFGAKILHPSSIKPARRADIPVRLLNTLSAKSKGTLISKRVDETGVKAIAAKSGITAIRIRSSEMLQAQGFLKKIFEVFELHKTSIDMITTSEVAVSVTIDDTENLATILQKLSEFSRVEVDSNMTIICVVGAHLAENLEIISKVISSVKSIPVRMISYGGSAHNISLLVSGENKISTLKLLHQGIFNVGEIYTGTRHV